jgi:hypothetical protein
MEFSFAILTLYGFRFCRFACKVAFQREATAFVLKIFFGRIFDDRARQPTGD